MLLVDYRSGSKELIEPLRKAGLKVGEEDLNSGDIAFIGRGEKGEPVWVGIEFKKLGELMQSFRSGRLQGHQLLKMQEDFRYNYLFIEGALRFNEHGRLMQRRGAREWRTMPGSFSVGELLKRLFSLHITTGMNWMMFDTRANTLKGIETLYRSWTDKDMDQHKSQIAMYDPPPLVPISEQRQLLAKLPGISTAFSKGAVTRFGSVRNAINAPAKQWAEVVATDDKGKARRLGDAAGQKIEEFVTTIDTGGRRARR